MNLPYAGTFIYLQVRTCIGLKGIAQCEILKTLKDLKKWIYKANHQCHYQNQVAVHSEESFSNKTHQQIRNHLFGQPKNFQNKLVRFEMLMLEVMVYYP